MSITGKEYRAEVTSKNLASTGVASVLSLNSILFLQKSPWQRIMVPEASQVPKESSLHCRLTNAVTSAYCRLSSSIKGPEHCGRNALDWSTNHLFTWVIFNPPLSSRIFLRFSFLTTQDAWKAKNLKLNNIKIKKSKGIFSQHIFIHLSMILILLIFNFFDFFKDWIFGCAWVIFCISTYTSFKERRVWHLVPQNEWMNEPSRV